MRRLTLVAALAALFGTGAAGQLSRKDRAIDLIRSVMSPFAGLSGTTYDDLGLDQDMVSLQQLMSPGEFDATGLNNLSPDEIRSLDRWVSEFAFDLLRPGSGRGCSPALESKIDGEFEGWSGDTIFKLTNGQIWQQASYSYTYRYKYRPDVLIFSSSGGCKMLVEGMDKTIEIVTAQVVFRYRSPHRLDE